jgi:hypothetical protein
MEGAIIVVETTDGNAPQGEWQTIASFARNSGTITLDTAVTAALAASDRIMYVSDFFPLYTMIECANGALRYIGNIVSADTSLTTAAAQREYALPIATKNTPIWDVLLQQKSGDADDNRWQPIDDWWVKPGATGSTSTLLLKTQPTATRSLMIVYDLAHNARVNTYEDKINQYIHPELAVAAGVERALRWQNSRLGGADRFWLERWNDAKNELQIALQRFPVWEPESPHILSPPDRGVSEYTGASDSVISHRRYRELIRHKKRKEEFGLDDER